MIVLNNRNLCENCFAEVTADPCPHCGFSRSTYRQDPVTLAIGTVLSQRYLVGGTIGKGGFGITYLAYDLKLDAPLAVKEYYPMGLTVRSPGSPLVAVASREGIESFRNGAEKFYNEAKMVAGFNGNPNIVSVHDFFFENDTVYFTMGYLQGQTLKSYIRGNKITEGQAVNLLYSISNALMAAHSQSILHRDVSPDNIMLCRDGTIRLLDFGAARQILAEQSQSLSVILKQGYAPLEQYQKKGKQGPWTDIYALGATVYTALTGELLLDPMTRLEDDTEYSSNKHGISPGLWHILSKCTQLKMQDRYPDIPALIADLQQTGIEKEPFRDIKEEINEKLRYHMETPMGGTLGNGFASSDPNATMLLGPGSGDTGYTMSMQGFATGQPPISGQIPVPGQPQPSAKPQPAAESKPSGRSKPAGRPKRIAKPGRVATILSSLREKFSRPSGDTRKARRRPRKGRDIQSIVIMAVLVIALFVAGFLGYKIFRYFTGAGRVSGSDLIGSEDTFTNKLVAGKVSAAGDEAVMLGDLGEKDPQKYTHEQYRYSICFPKDCNIREQKDGTVEIFNDDEDLHIAVRYKDRYIDDSILYDSLDMSNLINARSENLLPSENAGNTPIITVSQETDIAEKEDIRRFLYTFSDRNANGWVGNVYLFDPEGQYGCYMVYTLISEQSDNYSDLVRYAKACVDSFRIVGEYDPPHVNMFDFDDYGIKFSMTQSATAATNDTDSAEGTIHVKFNEGGDASIAYVIPGEHFGTEFVEMFTGAADSLSKSTIDITSDMIPLDIGLYKGYWVRTDITYSSGNTEEGRIYAFTTPGESDARYESYVVMGTAKDDAVLREIVGGFRFEGAAAYDNQSVDTDDTISLSGGTSADDDISIPADTTGDSEYIFPDTDVKEMTEDDVYTFLHDYLEANDALDLGEKERDTLCARALCYARNEIYARHGYIFKSGELKDLFGSKSWYNGTIPSDQFDSSVFSETEKNNIELFKTVMDHYGGYQPAQ